MSTSSWWPRPGDNLLLLSDLGDPVDPGDPSQLVNASNDTLTFDDDAVGRVPSQFDLPSGSFLPSNTGSGDAFPGTAPAPSSDTRLADAFTGIDPTGTWRLFIIDDADGERGDLAAGWSLTITTEEAAEATTTTVTSSDATFVHWGPPDLHRDGDDSRRHPGDRRNRSVQGWRNESR